MIGLNRPPRGAGASLFSFFLSLLLMASAIALPGCFGRKEKPNILLVTVDTLRADRLHCYGYPLSISPTVDALAARGVLFENCTAQASSTAPSFASMMTGLYPAEAGVKNNAFPLSSSCDTAATILKRLGYRTAAFVSNYNLRRRMGFWRGFDGYNDRMPDRELNRSGVPERTADKTTDAFLAWFEANGAIGSPFFVWLHYQDPHGPYTPPEEFVPPIESAGGGGGDLPLLKGEWGTGGIPPYQVLGDHRDFAYYSAHYDGEIAFFDSHFARVLKALEKKGVADKTVIVFTADHGESMGEHGFFFSHEQDLFNELIHVPLIVAVPGAKPGRRADRVGLIDILPTLDKLAGGEDSFRGRDLLDRKSNEARRPLYSETNFVAARTAFRSVIVDHWKLILSSRKGAAPLLFDLASDPGEKNNLYNAHQDAARQLLFIVRAEMRKSRPDKEAVPLNLSPEEEKALKSLGYIGG